MSGGLLVGLSLAWFQSHKPQRLRRARQAAAAATSVATATDIPVQAGGKPAPAPHALSGGLPPPGHPFEAAAWEPEQEGGEDAEMGWGCLSKGPSLSLSKCPSQLSFAEWSSPGKSTSLASELDEPERDVVVVPLTPKAACTWAALTPVGSPRLVAAS